MIDKRPALGKGLSALIPDVPDVPRPGPLEVDIDQLSPNEQQPRLEMNDARLEELAQSIRAKGIIQPILVRRVRCGSSASSPESDAGALHSGPGC